MEEQVFTAETLLSLNSYPESTIEAILRAGDFRRFRKEKISFASYPRVNKVAEKIDQELLDEAIRAIEKYLKNNPPELLSKIILIISNAVEQGLDINAKNKNGRALIHELVLKLPDYLVWLRFPHSVPDDIFAFLESFNEVTVDWNVRDKDGNSVLHYIAQHSSSDEFSVSAKGRFAQHFVNVCKGDPVAVNKKGQIPSDCMRGNEDHIKRYIKNYLEADIFFFDRELAAIRSASRFSIFSNGPIRADLIARFDCREWTHLFVGDRFPFLTRSRMINFLWTVDEYFDEADIKKMLFTEIKRNGEEDATVFFDVLLEYGDILQHYPRIINVLYSEAIVRLKPNKGCFVEHQMYCVKKVHNLAQTQKETHAGANFVAALIAFIEKDLWFVVAEDKKWIDPSGDILRLLNDLSYEEIRNLLLKTDSQGNALVSYLKNKNIAWLDYVRSPDVLDFLCSKNISIDFGVLEESSRGGNPLHRACNENLVGLVRYFVQTKNANVNARGVLGETPLHLASRTHNLELAVFLVNHGADVNSETSLANCNQELQDLGFFVAQFASGISFPRTPLEEIEWEKLNPEQIRQWKEFLEPKMGIRLEDLSVVRNLGLTIKEFSKLPDALRKKIIENFEQVKDLVLISTMPLKILIHFDTTPDKRLLINFIDLVLQKEPRAEIKKAVDDLVVRVRQLGRHAEIFGMMRNRGTPFWAAMPRDVAVMIATFARPDGIPSDAARVIANKIIPKK